MKPLLAIAALTALAACEDMGMGMGSTTDNIGVANAGTDTFAAPALPDFGGPASYATVVAEYPNLTRAEFDALDTNDNGLLDFEEVAALNQYVGVAQR